MRAMSESVASTSANVTIAIDSITAKNGAFRRTDAKVMMTPSGSRTSKVPRMHRAGRCLADADIPTPASFGRVDYRTPPSGASSHEPAS